MHPKSFFVKWRSFDSEGWQIGQGRQQTNKRRRARSRAAEGTARGESSSYVQGCMTEANYDIIEKLTAWVQERERGLNELAEAWLLAEPAVCSVISGATSVEHVLCNAKAAAWVLADAELKEIRSILKPES